MIIAGLTGGIRHGKTTFANLLALQSKSSHHFESWELVAEVAAALRAETHVHPSAGNIAAINEWLYPLADLVNLHVHANVSFEDLKLTDELVQAYPEHYTKLFEYLQLIEADPSLADTDITADTKETFRPLLQWLGGYLVAKVGSGVWYDELVRRIAHLRSSGYNLVTVGGVRYPGDAERIRNAGGVIICIERPDLPQQDAQDLTEREREAIQSDAIIVNNATISQLETCARQVYHDLSMRQLQPKYLASDTKMPLS